MIKPDANNFAERMAFTKNVAYYCIYTTHVEVKNASGHVINYNGALTTLTTFASLPPEAQTPHVQHAVGQLTYLRAAEEPYHLVESQVVITMLQKAVKSPGFGK